MMKQFAVKKNKHSLREPGPQKSFLKQKSTDSVVPPLRSINSPIHVADDHVHQAGCVIGAAFLRPDVGPTALRQQTSLAERRVKVNLVLHQPECDNQGDEK